MVPLRRPLTAGLLALLLFAPAAQAGRPTDPGTGVYGLPNYQVAEEPPYCTEDVCVHWVATTADAPPNLSDGNDPGTVPDAIETVASGLQHAHDHMTDTLGWREPVPDGALGGGTDLVDFYVKRLDNRASGVAVRDDAAEQEDGLRPQGFVILESVTLGPGNLGFAQRKLGPHELQHLIEYAYDGYFESWNGESTAEWAAAQSDGSYALFPQFASAWAGSTEFPVLGVRDPQTGYPPPKGYVDVVWQRWLSDRFGTEVVRGVWERGAQVVPNSFFPASLDAELAGRSTFFDEFVESSVANAEWRLPSSGHGFGPGGPDVERVGRLDAGGGATTVTLDHTTYALLDVPVTDAATYELRAQVPEGTAGAVALVGRLGSADGGSVVTAVQRLPEGGEARVGLADPARFERVTVVLVNADVSLKDPPRVAPWEWNYARDGQAFTARVVKTDRPPPPVEPAESPVVEQPRVDQQPPPPPPVIVEDLVPPRVRVATVPRRALALLRRGRAVRVTVLVDEPQVLSADVRRGATILLRSRAVRGSSGRRVVTLRASSRAARRRLARVRRATLVLVARDSAGNARTVRLPLR